MIELNTKQQARLLEFANKAYTKVAELADEARFEENSKKRIAIVDRGIFLSDFLYVLDGKYNNWSTSFVLEEIDRLINEYDLFEVSYNPLQQNISDIVVSPIGGNGNVSGDFALQTSLNAEAAARIARDNDLQTDIDAVDQRVTDLDFSGLVPPTVVFSEETPGFQDFPTLLGTSFPNKAVLDTISEQDLLDIDSHNTHVADSNIHVTTGDKNTWNGKVSQAELTSALTGKAPTVHGHSIGQITDLQSELNALAQSIIDNAAQDGVTPTLSIGTVTQGVSTSVTLDPSSTSTNAIFNFVLQKGDKGDQGEAFAFDAVDFLANRVNFINEAFGFTFVDVQTGLVYYKQAGAGTDSWSGGIRTIGDKGWTPIYRPEIINNAGIVLIVHKLVDYIGGEGVKPTSNIGAYVGTSGFVTNPLLAVNYKGSKGDKPVLGIDYTVSGFEIDEDLTYAEYLSVKDNYLATKPVPYFIFFKDSVSPYQNKNGYIAQLNVSATTGQREWNEYRFTGDQGVAGATGPVGPAGADGLQSVEEYANLASFPVTGVSEVIYIAANTNFTYRWNGSAYVQISGGAGAVVDYLQSFTYSGTNTFTLTETPEKIVFVTRNGKIYDDIINDYSFVGTTLTINDTDLVTGDKINIYYYTNLVAITGDVILTNGSGTTANGSAVNLGGTVTDANVLINRVADSLGDNFRVLYLNTAGDNGGFLHVARGESYIGQQEQSGEISRLTCNPTGVNLVTVTPTGAFSGLNIKFNKTGEATMEVGSTSTVKKSIQLLGYGEASISDETGVDYSGLAFNSLIPRKLADSSYVKKGLTESTGTVIAFDEPRKYGYPTAETGNITFSFTNAVEGTTQVLRHNSGTAPTLGAEAVVLGGAYNVSINNYIYMTPIEISTGVWEVHITYNHKLN